MLSALLAVPLCVLQEEAGAPDAAPPAELVVVGEAAAELPAGTLAVELLGAESFEARLERDRTITFTVGSATEALEEVERLTARERAAAWVAIGQVQHLPSRPLLRDRARNGADLERLGALLGLASYGPGDEALFGELARGDDAALAGCAVLALALSGSTRGRDELSRLAEELPERADDIAAALQLVTQPASAAANPNANLWLELRWLAARRWGFVAGGRWEQLLVEALCASDRFLEVVVLSAASRARGTGVNDHLMQHLLQEGGRSAVEAVARAMPSDLARAIRHGLWAPHDVGEWAAIFGELERGESQAEVVQLLRSAVDREDVGTRAAVLWIGTGDPRAAELVGEYGSSPDPKLRQALARALGATRDKEWVAELSRMRLDAHPQVRSEALVAQVRLGHAPAAERLRSVLGDPSSAERPRVVGILADLTHARPLQPFAVEAQEGSQGAEQLLLSARLLAEGVSVGRPLVHEALASGAAPDLAPEMVRALAGGATSADRELLVTLFPAEGPFELNVALARALLEVEHPEIEPVVRAALWRGPWHRSQLAAALLVSLKGIRGLVVELETPPSGAGSKARRRVGFAVGELGGFAEVEDLARRRRSGDPGLQGAYLGALSARTH